MRLLRKHTTLGDMIDFIKQQEDSITPESISKPTPTPAKEFTPIEGSVAELPEPFDDESSVSSNEFIRRLKKKE